jgi:predicted aspartyl protease
MTTKINFTTICIGLFLSLGLSLNAQTKLKQKSQPATFALERFLTVKHGYIKIPITKMASGHLHVKVVLNGVNGEFILDTGAGATVVETKRQGKFNLQTDNNVVSGAGAGGVQTLQQTTNTTIKVGNLVKNNFNVYLMNLDHVNEALSSMGLAEVDGVIGADVLTENKAIIDYSNLILYLKK